MTSQVKGSSVPWYLRTGAWIGIGTGPGALMVGAGMASEVGPDLARPAAVVGCILLYLVAVGHGVQAVETRAAMGESIGRVFGPGLPAWTITGVLVIAMVGWCGFYLGVGGAALSDLLGVGQSAGSSLLAALVLGAALMGHDRWNVLIYLTAACAVALSVFTVVALPASPPASVADPPVWIGLPTAVGGVIAYAVVFAMRAPDFTVDLEGRRAVWAAGLTMLGPLLFLALLGVWLYARTGLFDLAGVLARTEAPQAGQLFLAASVIAPSVTALYSCAVSVASLKAVSPRVTMIAVAIVATLLGIIRFDLRLISFLQGLASIVPAALVVMLAYPRLRPPPLPPHGFFAWLLGSATAAALWPWAPFLGMVTASVTALAWLLLASKSAKQTRSEATRMR